VARRAFLAGSILLESILILDWSTLRPWHWVGLSIATTGGAMLWISGHAIADYRTRVDYGQEKPWSLQLMHRLWRLRRLAVIAGLLLAFGSILVHLAPDWLAWLSDRQAQTSDRQAQTLQDYYRVPEKFGGTRFLPGQSAGKPVPTAWYRMWAP